MGESDTGRNHCKGGALLQSAILHIHGFASLYSSDFSILIISRRRDRQKNGLVKACGYIPVHQAPMRPEVRGVRTVFGEN